MEEWERETDTEHIIPTEGIKPARSKSNVTSEGLLGPSLDSWVLANRARNPSEFNRFTTRSYSVCFAVMTISYSKSRPDIWHPSAVSTFLSCLLWAVELNLCFLFCRPLDSKIKSCSIFLRFRHWEIWDTPDVVEVQGYSKKTLFNYWHNNNITTYINIITITYYEFNQQK